MIVSDPDSPYKGHYDEEIVLTLSDWYHEQMPNLMKRFISVTNPTGAEPIPQAALMNDTQNLMTPVEPGKTYMFRIINMAAFAGQYFWFEGHTMRIVEVDGIYTEAAEANMIYLTAAQRYSVLISTKTDASANFAYMASMDQVNFCRFVALFLLTDHVEPLRQSPTVTQPQCHRLAGIRQRCQKAFSHHPQRLRLL